MSILAKLLADIGVDPETEPRNTTAGKFLAREGVWAGEEFHRIKSLPRRVWQTEDLSELCELLSNYLKTPHGARKLLPMQAAALRELHDLGRLNVVANVGQGKTDIAALAPRMLDSKRALFITYARLLDKTLREFRLLAEQWKLVPYADMISFERLQRAESADYLRRLEPDLIVVDESHGLKSAKSARSKRLSQYLKAHPECKFVPLTGTPGDDSLQDIAHIQEWVHGESSPLPRTYHELQMWCQAVDASVRQRRAPGVLRDFAEGNSEDLTAVRAGVGARIEETPGNIYSRSGDVACSLYLDYVRYDASDTTEQIFEHVRKSGDTLPDGRVLETPLELYLLFQTLSLGFARVIDPPPPKEWRDRRRDMARFVTDILSQTASGLCSPKEVLDLCKSGELDSEGVYESWMEIKPSFVMHSEIQWFDDHAVEFVADYALKNNCLVWVPFPAFGRKLRDKTGLPYFHHNGKDEKLGSIEEYPGGSSVILSTQANSTGRNLQDRWHENFIVAPSAKSDQLEQQIGRTHRRGQKAEEVTVRFLLGSVENYEALMRARGRALLDRDIGRSSANKILSGDWLLPTPEIVNSWAGARWHK